MELRRVEIAQYANGFIATGYDRFGMSILDSEPKETKEESVNNLLFWLNKTEEREVES